MRLCHGAAFFANRPLLVNRRASRLQRLRLVHALVTASFRWSLCVLSVKQGVLQRLRVHCVTLLTWLLGVVLILLGSTWNVCKCCGTVSSFGAASIVNYGALCLRTPSTSLTRCVLLDLQTEAKPHWT